MYSCYIPFHWKENNNNNNNNNDDDDDDRNTYYPSPFTRARESITLQCGIFLMCAAHSCIATEPGEECQSTGRVSGHYQIRNAENHKQQHWTTAIKVSSYFIDSQCWRNAIHCVRVLWLFFREEISKRNYFALIITLCFLLASCMGGVVQIFSNGVLQARPGMGYQSISQNKSLMTWWPVRKNCNQWCQTTRLNPFAA